MTGYRFDWLERLVVHRECRKQYWFAREDQVGIHQLRVGGHDRKPVWRDVGLARSPTEVAGELLLGDGPEVVARSYEIVGGGIAGR